MRDSNDVVTAGGILLMTQHPPRQFLLMRHRDRWDLPKGHSEPGESPLQTALRETHEETGITAQQIRLDADFRFELEYPVRYKRSGDQVFTKRVHYFLGYIESQPELCLSEHESYQWFDWNPPHQIQAQTIDPLLRAIAENRSSRLPN